MNTRRRFLTPALLLFVVAATAAGQVNPKNMDPAAAPRGSPLDSGTFPSPWAGGITALTNDVPVHRELYQLWKTLPGRYESTDGTTKVTMTLRAVYTYVLFVEIRKDVGGHESVDRGYLGLADASPSYTSRDMRFAIAYQPESLRRNWSCALFGRPTADGITFESEVTDCSFTLGRTVSKLRFDAAADSISLSAAGDGEVTLARKASK